MYVIVGIVAVALICLVLVDVFETVVLPRRASGRVRLTNMVFALTWQPWRAIGRRLSGQRRDVFLGYYGPLAFVFLLVVWATALIFGYALLQWAMGSQVAAAGRQGTLGSDLYFSGTTFLTLGLGDVVPMASPARVLTVIEAATGFGSLALVIGYLPVLYQAFSRREASIALLDSRAGSPPSAVELFTRYAEANDLHHLEQFLIDWERWCAELLESHISYPSVGFFRSQHDNQSWLAALTVVLDVSALVMAGIDGIETGQARRTFAMARHAAVDLSQIFQVPPHRGTCKRLTPASERLLRKRFADVGLRLQDTAETGTKLTSIRAKYEPYVSALSEQLLLDLPPWVPGDGAMDDWQTSIYEHSTTRSFEEIVD